MAALNEFDLYESAEASIEAIKAINTASGNTAIVRALDDILHLLVDIRRIHVEDEDAQQWDLAGPTQ